MTSSPDTLPSVPPAEHRMKCMELWGGSRETDMAVQMTGLRGRVLSLSYGKGEHGGDVYYFSSCASGRISRIMLADVAGHGADVSQTAIALREVLRRYVNVVRQDSLVRSINQEVVQLSTDGTFATGLVMTYFSSKRTLSVSVAGHPPPLIFRRSAGNWSRFPDADTADSRALPFGVTPESSYQTYTTRFDPGDLILLYTDAYSEAVSEEGEIIGTEGLRSLLEKSDDADPSTIIPGLVQRLKGQHESNLANDDATVILLEPTGNRIPLKDNLLAPFRLVSKVNYVPNTKT